MAKRLFKSYSECESAYRTASRESTLSAIALNAIVGGEEITTIRKGAYTAKIIRPTSACGGIVVITFRHPGQLPSSSAHYIDEWCEIRNRPAPSYPDADNREFFDVRDLALKSERISA